MDETPATQEAGAHFGNELLVSMAAAAARPCQPRVEAAPRDTERPAHPVRRPDPPVLQDDTPRSLIRRTASSLNSRVNFRLSMTHLQIHQNTYSVSAEPVQAKLRIAVAKTQAGSGRREREGMDAWPERRRAMAKATVLKATVLKAMVLWMGGANNVGVKYDGTNWYVG
jgi:hypothetical protein